MKSYKQQREERAALTLEEQEVYDYWSPYFPHERAMKEAKAKPFPSIENNDNWDVKHLRAFLNGDTGRKLEGE